MIHLLLFRSLALGSTIAKISIPTYATISRYANTQGHSKLLSLTLPSTKLVLKLILQKIQFSAQQLVLDSNYFQYLDLNAPGVL